MAGLRRQLRTLQNDPNLGQFIMRDATPTGRQLGVGSYGSVEEIKVDELVCAGKTIHEALLEAENFGAENIAKKYVQECQLMAGLRHPNVTLFLGLCFLPSATLPVLVMERLESSLDDLLETAPNIPLALKRSILEDVARGLLYLHRRDPPIIHRDLTARNVLLTSSFSAKVTDLGNSRIVNLQPGQLAKTLSRVPGTMTYMPPEALSMASRYGPSLDIFSFGHLGLFTGLQEFPGDLLEPNYPDPDNPERLVGRSEVERREVYFEQLESSLLRGGQHPFVRLVKQCLHNTPSQRPTTEVLLRTLEETRAEIEGPFGSNNVVKLGLMKQVAVNRTLKQAESEVRRKDREIRRLQQELEQTQVSQDGLRADLRAKEADLQARIDQLRDKERELLAKDDDISRLQRELQSCQAQLQRTETPLSQQLESRVQHGLTRIDENEITVMGELGAGMFSSVREGLYKPKGGGPEIKVAIRCFKPTEDLENQMSESEILREAITMAMMDHPNIVRLYGISETDHIRFVIEIAPFGGLNKFLRRHPTFQVLRILSMMVQVAQGMEYLEHIRFVHRNLSARNVLVMDEENVKISDFRLSRAIRAGNEYYTAETAGRWPIKWYAPECIYFANFNSKSDVWSYGVTVWEAFSYGSKPYPGMKAQDIMKMLERNQRLDCPDKCPQPVYDILCRCWSWKAEDRPAFHELSTLMKDIYSTLQQAQQPPQRPPRPVPVPRFPPRHIT